MSAQTAALQGRAAAVRDMVDTCTVRRQTGRTLDETTGQYTPTFSVIYTGPCKLQAAPRTLQGESEVGGREAVTLVLFLHLPITVTTVAVDDVATVDASLDPVAVGRKLRVAQVAYKTFPTARRLPVEDVTA